ncbi:MAG: phosphotransferase [Thermoleophilaceae bacterium]|nr:phosphotransferase [Thermoleophilaceae bacterium]
MAGATRLAEGADHPAMRAWRRLRGQSSAASVAVETLQKRKKGKVYLLAGAGPGGQDVVAKWSSGERVRREALAYERVLPSLPVSRVRHHGTLAAEDGWWLFVARADGEEYSNGNPRHRSLAGRWLGVLHTAAAEAVSLPSLPDRGPGYYLDALELSRAEISAQMTNPALTRTDVSLLRDVVTQCEIVASRWAELEGLLLLTPPTFIHGDFAPKNMNVQGEPTAALRPFDWASSGWGSPAPDLPQLDVTRTDYWASPDLDVYHSTVAVAWPKLSRRDVLALSVIGKVLRTLVCIRLEAPGIASDWPEASMKDMRYYHSDLRDALRRTGWGG